MGLEPEAVGAAGVGVVLAVGDDGALAAGGDADAERRLRDRVGDPARVLRVRRALLARAHPRQAAALVPVQAHPALHRDRPAAVAAAVAVAVVARGPDVLQDRLAVLGRRALFCFFPHPVVSNRAWGGGGVGGGGGGWGGIRGGRSLVVR